MQPSEEFRPLPHIYLSARHGSAARRQRDLGRARSAGPPFIARQPRGAPRSRGSTNKRERERGSEITESRRRRRRRGREARIPTRPVPGHYYTALARIGLFRNARGVL